MVYPANSKLVVIVLYDNVQLLDFAGPADVLAQANKRAGRLVYEIQFVTSHKDVRGLGMLTMNAVLITSMNRVVHTLVVPGGPAIPITDALHDPELLAWIARAASSATRIISICSGAFLLGRLGLLNGHRATTHWMALDRFEAEFPAVSVERDALFVEDRRIWSSAGVASGIDLALAIVSSDLGSELALEVARDLVLHLVRPGGQSQFTGPLSLQAKAGPELSRLVPWLEQHLNRPIIVAEMADALGMTERSFHRRCQAVFGLAPAKLLTELRLERARTLLCDRALGVKFVAAMTGFSDPAAFSTAFCRRFGATPTAYRKAFAVKSAHII